MSDVRELYQSVILDHNKRPRNFRKVEGANRRAEGYNPLCGDKVSVQLRIEDGV
ncbi:MAG TPA: iron-sulfur cluster assembly scaffold protein, partial [Myxococcota bacterium]|nr:iron-sulfur cluster assembly scaffold protein [Myxococcota bacterium]